MGLFGLGSKQTTKCKECGTELPTPERLKKHQEIAHKKNKDRCRNCGAEFHTSDELKKHKKKCR